MAALSTASVCTKVASDCFCGVKSDLIASIVSMSLLTVKYEAVSNCVPSVDAVDWQNNGIVFGICVGVVV